MSHSRQVTNQKRQYNRQVYYQIIKAIKQSNLKGERISYLQLAALKLIGTTILNKFIRNAEAWGIIEGNGESTGYRWYKVTPVGDTFLSYCEKLKNESSKSTTPDLTMFFEVAAKVHAKTMTSKKAAASLNLSQRIFAAMMKQHAAQIKANAKEHEAAHAHEYYLNHKDEYSERSKQYYLSHLDEVLTKRKAYYSEHATEVIDKQKLRRQRKKQKQQSS